MKDGGSPPADPAVAEGLSPQATPATVPCVHCGAPAPAAPAGAPAFCCPGCRAAYALVTGLGLDSYYRKRTIDPEQRPLRPDEDAGAAAQAARIEEERRLMYVGITRARQTLAVSWTRRRKKGRETVAALPSRFIAEMALDKSTAREDPREKLRALRAEFAQRAAPAATAPNT